MPLQTRIDHFSKVDRIVLTIVLLVLLCTGLLLDLFGPSSYSFHTQCAFECSDNNYNTYSKETCEGVDFGNGETFVFDFTPIQPLNRINELHMTAYLHSSQLRDDYSIGLYHLSTNMTLFYKEDGLWKEWYGGVFTSKFHCNLHGSGQCSNMKWIDEPYFMHSEQRLVVTYAGEKGLFANLCLQQYYGSDYYGILRIVTTCLFTVITVGYLIYYIIYLLVKRIKLRDLDGQQALNILLMIFGLMYNDPINLIGLLLPSAFFPIFHGIVHMSFIAYVIFFVVAFFHILRGKTALVSKPIEWTVTILATMGLIVSFAFASSIYLHGITINPFDVKLNTSFIAWALYMCTLFCGVVVALWLFFIFFSSFKIIKAVGDIKKVMYFCLSSVFIIGMEFVLLLVSDYSTFFNNISVPLIVLFGVNAYLFCMFYAFVPSFKNEFNDRVIAQNYDDDAKPILYNQEGVAPAVDSLDN